LQRADGKRSVRAVQAPRLNERISRLIMHSALPDLTHYLLERLDSIRSQLGLESQCATADTRFADALDSMGMAEFLALISDDCGVSPTQIEECAERRFGSVVELATAMQHSGISLRPPAVTTTAVESSSHSLKTTGWLAGLSVRLPQTVQFADTLNAMLQRPAGWLQTRAGIQSRRIWQHEDPLLAATDSAREALTASGVPPEEIGALLVTSEAPPLLAGLAAQMHHRLELHPQTVALEVGGACTGFLAALWLARSLPPTLRYVLLVAVEAPSLYLDVKPGPAGEAAALFGDGTAAAILCQEPAKSRIPLLDVVAHCHGDEGRLLRVERSTSGSIALHMASGRLALRAVRMMAEEVHELTGRRQLKPTDLAGIVAHGGNGRMPAMVARQLGLPTDSVWSRTPETGNLGSVSLPAAFAQRDPLPRGPVAWVSVGAGLVSAGALTGEVK
jgi:3-oxoacyl-[acyl-carrier-protein] synthase-3